MADELTGLELRSLITDQGQLRITLDDVAVGEPNPGEVVVRVEAAPINPSDLGLLLGPARSGHDDNGTYAGITGSDSQCSR